MQLQKTLDQRQAYLSNLQNGQSALSEVDSTLGSLTDLLQQAQNIASGREEPPESGLNWPPNPFAPKAKPPQKGGLDRVFQRAYLTYAPARHKCQGKGYVTFQQRPVQ